MNHIETILGIGLGAATALYLWSGSSSSAVPPAGDKTPPKRAQRFSEEDLRRYNGEGEKLCFVACEDGVVVDCTDAKDEFRAVGGTRLTGSASASLAARGLRVVGELIVPKEFTVDELLAYNGVTRAEIFVAAKGIVYDVSSSDYLYGVEGGYHIMAGRDASRALATMSLDIADVDNTRIDDLSRMDLMTLDEWIAKYELKYYRVGTLAGWTVAGSPRPSSIAANDATFLSKAKQLVILKEKIRLSHDTHIYRFELPPTTPTLGLPIGKHVKLWCPNPSPSTVGMWNGIEDKESGKQFVERKYTPSSLDSENRGFFDIAIKTYRPNERFVDGGKMSQFVDDMVIGDSINVAGPFGLIEYQGNGDFFHKKKVLNFKFVGMIAGGTGVTPMLQLIKAVCSSSDDHTQLSLLFANQTEDDILLREMLEELAEKHADKFKLHYTLDRPPAGWKQSSGFIDAGMIAANLPPPGASTVVLMCGPPPMIKFACRPNLEKLGYAKEATWEF